jgi:ankyrin repeat protein
LLASISGGPSSPRAISNAVLTIANPRRCGDDTADCSEVAMRLLNTTTFELHNFSHDAVPRQYAILSHIWGKEEDEISFRDIQEGRIKEAASRPTKLEGCCKIAKKDGYEYIWVDTCCIDNTNSVELQAAINSMFRWYKNASICYAYLSDVPADDKNPWDPKSKFSSSRWFERGWTLQELLAPPRLRFYNSAWHCHGTKGDLCAIIEKATGIPSPHLLGIRALRDASVAQRMSWAANRVTKQPEDIAYCLLGIFGVAMPMIYGEGHKKAFRRLQELIMTEIGDDSILAWGLGQTESTSEPLAEPGPGCILASSPADFAKCGNILAREHASRDSFDKFGGCLRLHIPLFISAPGTTFGLLKCGDSGRVVGIPLTNILSDGSCEYIRPQDRHPVLVPEPGTAVSRTPLLVRIEHENRTPIDGSQKYWFNVQGSVETDLELIDVEPQSSWRKEEALIEAALTFHKDPEQHTFVRFRHMAGEAHDFLVILELRTDGSQSEVEARCHVMVCDRDTSLGAVALRFNSIRPEAMGKQIAGNGLICLQVIIEPVQEETMFFLRIVPLNSQPEITYDATVELQILGAKMEINVLQKEESAAEQDFAVLETAIQKTNEIFKSTTEEWELVKRELSLLEAKQAQLVIRLEDGRKATDHLIQSQKNTRDRQDSLVKRRSSTQRHLQLLSDKANLTISTSDADESEAERVPILSWAAMYGHLGVVRVLIDIGAADIESKIGKFEMTPLHLAVVNGHHTTILILIDHGANVDAKDDFHETPLFDALRAKDEVTVRLLVEKGADVTAQGIDGRQPLHVAAKYGVRFAVELFLEKGVDINVKDKYSRTALHEAARYGMHQIADILLKNDAVVDATNDAYETPLYLAAAKGEEVLSRLLINTGANVNAKNNVAQTPLHVACQSGHLAVSELLIQKGANIEARTSSDDTPLNIAAQNEQKAIVELLIEKGASWASNKYGWSPLHCAAATGNEAILKTLLESSSSSSSSSSIYLNQLSNTGKSPLDYALKGDYGGAAELLQSQGALESSEIGNDTKVVQQSGTNGNSVVARQVLTNGGIIQYDQLISSRSAVSSPPNAAVRHSLGASEQLKSPRAGYLDKIRKLRKST